MKRLIVLLTIFTILSSALTAAKITNISGNTEVLKSGDAVWAKAKAGMELSENDKIRCAVRSRAAVKFTNGHRINVWPKSEIAIKTRTKSDTKIELLKGRLRSWVKKLRGNQKYEVKTPVAVCSVRGTDFSVEVGDDNRTTVQVYEGQVAASEESTGREVIINEGEFSSISPNQAPSEPQDIPPDQMPTDEGVDAQGSQASEEDLAKEEALNEVFNEISKEDILGRADEEIKLAEYQNGKAIIDVTGKRVRMEEYIVRSRPKEFKYVVLNERDDTFNFGKIIFTFNDTLPEDLTSVTKTMFELKGSVKPDIWLTDVVSVMSNTQDQVNEVASGGDMYADNAAYPSKWTHGWDSYIFYVNNVKWWSFIDSNGNGQVDSASELGYFDLNGNAVTSITSEFKQPSGDTSFHFYTKNTYGDDQWIAVNDYIIDDEGNIMTLGSMQGKTSSELEATAYESNFERIYEASVFEGRKIDLVFSAKLLIDSGILNLPDLRTGAQAPSF